MSRERAEKPVVHSIMDLSLYVGWGWDGCGFGELFVKYDAEKNQWTADTECMGPQSVRKILHAAADKIADDLEAAMKKDT